MTDGGPTPNRAGIVEDETYLLDGSTFYLEEDFSAFLCLATSSVDDATTLGVRQVAVRIVGRRNKAGFQRDILVSVAGASPTYVYFQRHAVISS